jgi:betaine-aldehyde dehydrogenase
MTTWAPATRPDAAVEPRGEHDRGEAARDAAPTAAAVTGGVLTVLDPSDGSTVGEVREAGRDEVVDAVRRARAAQHDWERTPAADRGAQLHGAAAALLEHAAELATLNQRETGKPFDDSLGGVLAGADTLRQYAELGPLHRGRSLVGGRESADFTIDQPRGVVAAITPWNDPVAVACGLIGAALVTGNTVVHKPSERCPHVGELLGRVLAATLPPDVLVTVSGGGGVGAALTEQPDVDAVAHVGSTATGRRIARMAALTGAHVVLENGGNDALVVDGDVDPVWAAEQAAIGAFANAGQICTSVERIFVHRDVASAFVEALVAEAARRDDRREMGPLVDGRLRAEVQRQVDEAVADGATVEVGGSTPDGPGSWWPATVLTGCEPHMTIMQEETFGPVAPVQVVDDFDEALRLACHDRHGLAATVLTGSIAHANRALADLPVGTVKINAVFGGAPGGSAQPRGESGSGFGYGPELLDELTLTKVVHYGVPVLAADGGHEEVRGASSAPLAEGDQAAGQDSAEAPHGAVEGGAVEGGALRTQPEQQQQQSDEGTGTEVDAADATGRTPHPQEPAEGGDPDDTSSAGTGEDDAEPRVHPSSPAEGD